MQWDNFRSVSVCKFYRCGYSAYFSIKREKILFLCFAEILQRRNRYLFTARTISGFYKHSLNLACRRSIFRLQSFGNIMIILFHINFTDQSGFKSRIKLYLSYLYFKFYKIDKCIIATEKCKFIFIKICGRHFRFTLFYFIDAVNIWIFYYGKFVRIWFMQTVNLKLFGCFN